MKDFFLRLLANWKTTLAGLLTLVGLVLQCTIAGGNLFDCITNSWPVVFGGVGLLFAKDSDKE